MKFPLNLKPLTAFLSIALFLFSFGLFHCKKETSDFGQTSQENYFVFVKSNLNLRAKPDKNSDSLGKISRGSELKVLEKGNGIEKIEDMQGSWWKVQVNDKTGYMFSAYISRYKPTQKECHNIQGYLEEIYGEIKEGNANLTSFKAEEHPSCKTVEAMEKCRKNTDFSLKNGIDGTLVLGHEWGREEIYFPGMSDTEGFLLLRDCCGGNPEKPLSYSEFKESLDTGKELPEYHDIFYQQCVAKRRAGGLILGQESGL